MGKKISVKTNFLYNSAFQIFIIIVPLITTPYLTRTIGAKGIGEYGYGYAIAYYFGMIIKLGLNNYGGRQIAYIRNDVSELSKQFFEIYSFQLFMGFLSSVAYCGYCFCFSKQEISWIFLLYIFSSAIDITWFFWGLEEFKLTAKRDFLIKTLSTIGIFVFVRSNSDVWKYALLLCCSFFLSQLLLWPSLHKRIHWYKPSLDGIRKHIKPNIVLFIPTVAVSLYKIMDKIMLGSICNTTEVGFYNSSESLLQVPLALIISLGVVMQPRMANIFSTTNDDDKFDTIFEKSIAFAMFLATTIGFGIMTIANEFVPLFFGDGFDESIVILKVILPSCCFSAFANVIRTEYLIPRKKDKEYIVSLFIGAIINILFNCILIPYIGAVGAAVGTLIAEIIVCSTQVFLIRQERDIKRYIIIALPFMASGIGMYLIWNNVVFHVSVMTMIVIKILCASLTYIIILFIIFLLCKCFGLLSIK